jgi:hypothetical protein
MTRKPPRRRFPARSGSAAVLGVLLPAAWLLAALPVLAEEPLTVDPALQARVKGMINRTIASPAMRQFKAGSGHGSLAAYALLKAGQPLDSPAIRDHIRQLQQQLDDGPIYPPGEAPDAHIYEVTCHAVLLAELDPEENRLRLEKLRDYLVENQLANGSWYYPRLPSSAAGDTSVTQFAILGLWAVHRSQVEIPREALTRAARWLINTQKNDDGFAYHPFEGGGRPEDLVSSDSMTAAGHGTLTLIKLLLYGEAVVAAPTTPSASRRRFGVLEQVPLEGDATVRTGRRPSGEAVNISQQSLDRGISSSGDALAERFEKGLKGKFPIYFLYACERAGTIRQREQIGSHRWYEEGVEFLAQHQLPSGEWGEFGGHVPGPANTAFALLFLSRATRSLIKSAPRVRLVGGGLLAGGRGLPEDLNRVDVQNGTVTQRLKKGPVDDLLGQLEQPQEISLPAVQQALVESVSLENPDELVGQLERLQRLIRHPSAEVRQLAIWALGRSGEYRMTPVLIEQLADPDRIVAWEASMSLCVLSRLALGVTPVNAKQPLPIAPPEVNAEDPQTLVVYQRWVDQSRAAWDAWYLRVRPYDERDDRRQLPRK